MEGVMEVASSACKRPYAVTHRQWALDGSMVRHLMSFHALGMAGPSLSEVSVPGGWRTAQHAHSHAELYHVLAGTGCVELDGQRLDLGPGDTVAIPPNVLHYLEACLDDTLRMIWCHDGEAHAQGEEAQREVAPALPIPVKRPGRAIESALPDRAAPQLIVETSEDAEALRRNLAMTQGTFWSRVLVTQGGGSRYEGGRDIPLAVRFLLHLAYASDAEAQTVLNHLRRGQPTDDCGPESFSFTAGGPGVLSVRALRKCLGLTQTTFWGRIHLPQSAGSRYEAGRAMPKPIQTLVTLAYAPRNHAENLLASLRAGSARSQSKRKRNAVA